MPWLTVSSSIQDIKTTEMESFTYTIHPFFPNWKMGPDIAGMRATRVGVTDGPAPGSA